MLFNFEMVVKTNDSNKYKIGGSLTPEENDKEIFSDVREAYLDILSKEQVTFGNHLVVKDDCILFVNIDIVSMSNILKVLSKSLGFKITPVTNNNCKFSPASCEPLFRMEVHRLFE